MAKQEKMRVFDPPLRSMKQAVRDIRGDKGDIVEPIKERSRRIARRMIESPKGGSRPKVGRRGRRR